jgi:hypothetical protein
MYLNDKFERSGNGSIFDIFYMVCPEITGNMCLMLKHPVCRMGILMLGLTFTLAEAKVDFDQDIRPILSDNCFKCHGPDAAQREADLRLDTRSGLFGDLDDYKVVAPGDLEKSELFYRIAHEDPEERMPPADADRHLKDKEIALIKSWISEGAIWEQHWSLVPPIRPEEPTVSNPDWIMNPIDAFILAQLDAEGLIPSSKADPRILVRRLYFDLTGLPPTPDDVERFLNTSIKQTAHRVFKSPAYGEKMAIRWLDAARYADTSGYQNDGWREMWRWRDWVIDAYNSNMRFDEFTVQQLAGDLLPKPTLDELIATGFNRNHRGNAEGGIVPEEFQVEYVVDRVDTTFTIWQGMTMACARCHNHKYDPISQSDYYSAFAMFNNLPENGRAWKEGNSEPWLKAPTRSQEEQLSEKEESTARKEWDKGREDLDRTFAKWESQVVDLPKDWSVESELVFHETGDELKGREFEESGKFGYFDKFSFGARVKLDELAEGTILSRMVPVPEGRGHNLHLTEKGTLQANFVQRWLDDSVKIETLEPISTGEWIHVFVTYGGTRKAKDIKLYINGVLVPHKANYDFLNQNFNSDEPLRIGSGMVDFNGQIEDVRYYDRALTEEEIRVIYEPTALKNILALPVTDRSKTQSAKLKHYFLNAGGPPKLRQTYSAWKTAKETLTEFEEAIPTVMIMRDEMPRQTHILMRGVYDQPGDPVEPGVPSSLPPLPDDSPRNRLGLAQWLVSGDNPLTARVAVNRIWRDLFGTGLVKTTEDFGVQGERPSHPELLDWLAVEFVESGWDIQHMLLLIVSSNTYQQSSRVEASLQARDPENRLLARGPRFRLPAEMIRDQALAASGLLHKQIGGPSVKTYQPDGLWADFASDKDYVLATGNDLYRRSLYTYWKRTVPPPMMTNFDAAGREACDEALRRTNTPLQALNLMNDVTFVEAARVMAQGLLIKQKEDKKILQLAYEQLLGRLPEADEINILLKSKRDYLKRYSTDTKAAESLLAFGEWPVDETIPVADMASWTMICSTLLNLDETVTKE